MYRKEVRRRRAVLALLVIGSFVFLTATFGEGSGPVQSGVSTIFSPLENGASRALKPVQDLVNWVDETFDARGENERLKSELEDARANDAAGKAAIQENVQLSGLVGLPKAGTIPTGYEPMTGRVIARSPTAWYSTVTIDVGSGDGAAVDDPVVNGDGLVGHIGAVTSSTSQVILLTDPSSQVSGKVVPVGTQGIVSSEVGNTQQLKLDFIDSSERIGKGATVVTAGWSTGEIASRYPPDIPIGKVTRASIVDQEASQQVQLRPFADMRSLEFLQVLTGGGAG